MSAATLNPSDPTSAASLTKKQAHFRRLFLERVSTEDMAAVVHKLLEMAVESCFQATKLFLAYVVGRPDRVEQFYADEPLRDAPLGPGSPLAAARPVAASPSAGSPSGGISEVIPASRPAAPKADAPLLSAEEFERLLKQPLKSAAPAILDDAGRTSVLTGPDRKTKRS